MRARAGATAEIATLSACTGLGEHRKLLTPTRASAEITSGRDLWAARCIGAAAEFHFYCIHRLIHVPVLYKHIHSVHHNSVNPSPWSSLSMHPIEHLLYWSDSLIHLLLPSHPLLFLYGL